MAGTSLLAGLNAVSAAHVSYDETIKIGLIGCGGRGRGAAEQAMNTAGPTKLVAAADAFEDNLQSAINTLSRAHKDKVDVPKERQFVGFDAYKKVLESDVDLVILATPPGFARCILKPPSTPTNTCSWKSRSRGCRRCPQGA